MSLRAPASKLLMGVLLGWLVGCSHEAPPVEAAVPVPARLEPAPMPFVHQQRQGGNFSGYNVAVPPQMPAGTGAVPVSSSAFRGSVTTGYKLAF